MLKSYLKIAWRNIWNNKLYTLINVAGLSASAAIFLLLINFVRFETSYERFHKQAGDICRVTLSAYEQGRFVVADAETSALMAPFLKKELPEVKEYVRVQTLNAIREVDYGHTIFPVEKIYAADPSIFTVFNYPLVAGNAATALNAPLQVVVSESTAKKIFGNKPPVGQTIDAVGRKLTVTGVFSDVPANTHLKFDMLISFASVKDFGFRTDSWGWCNNYTYLLLAPGTSLAAFNERSNKLLKPHLGSDVAVAEPVKDIHLHSRKTFEPEVNGDAKTVRFLLAVAILILLVGAVNYVNLTTARAADRAKEVGVRKTLGSSRGLLVQQFLTETFFINILSFALTLGLVWQVLPAYAGLVGQPVTGFFNTGFWLTCLVLFVFNCLLSGLYPSMVLSRLKPAGATMRTFTGQAQGSYLRRGLVVFQMAVALVVVAASIIIYRQLNFMQGHELGMNTEEMLVVKAPVMDFDSAGRARKSAFKNDLLQLPGVKAVSVTEAVPGVSNHEFAALSNITRYGSTTGKGFTFYAYCIDADFVPAMQMKLVAGRNFISGGANKHDVLVSRDAAKILGFSNPEAAIGEKISFAYNDGAGYSTIVGVLENYHQQSLKEPMLPMIHPFDPAVGSLLSVKLSAGNLPQTLAAVEQHWKELYPGRPFDYYFLNEMFDRQYKADKKFSRIVEIFSGFTLFITCLGILGLTAYSVSRRSKEISIRKVLGASAASIVALLSGDFVRLALIAVVVATPLTWLAMHNWLQNFAYHTSIEWWVFALAGLLGIIVTLATAGLQSIRAALANPADVLKGE